MFTRDEDENTPELAVEGKSMPGTIPLFPLPRRSIVEEEEEEGETLYFWGLLLAVVGFGFRFIRWFCFPVSSSLGVPC